MSVLDLDYYKLTMLQFIWKHYDDVPVTFRMHSRKQDLGDILHVGDFITRMGALMEAEREGLPAHERDWLLATGHFEESFLDDLHNMWVEERQAPLSITPHGIEASGTWFETSLWETVALSMVSEGYSTRNVKRPSLVRQFGDIARIAESGAKWADFGTRRRWSYDTHDRLIALLAQEDDTGLVGTSNTTLARKHGLRPIGTYAHELEMVLRTQFPDEFSTTRDVLTKWGDMYPRDLKIALTDTYTTPNFLDEHGRFLLDNDWRGVRLDSGNPWFIGQTVRSWLWMVAACDWDVVFSDGLDAKTIVELQEVFGPAAYINPVFGWGTGLTNPNTDLSLVMKAVRANGQDTYKITDDETKAIR